MLFIPSGVLLNHCVCDGVERPFCEVVKENMNKLCNLGEGEITSDHTEVDDIYEDEDYDFKMERDVVDSDSMVSHSSSPELASHMALTLVLLSFAL